MFFKKRPKNEPENNPTPANGRVDFEAVDRINSKMWGIVEDIKDIKLRLDEHEGKISSLRGVANRKLSGIIGGARSGEEVELSRDEREFIALLPSGEREDVMQRIKNLDN